MLNSYGPSDTLSCNFLLNDIINQRFRILNFLFKLFIFFTILIVRRWSKFVPWYYFLPFWHVESLFFFLNQNISVMLLHSSITFYWSSNSQLLCPNSTFKSASSIWHSSLLEFCNKLLVRLYASPICTSWIIIDATWGVFIGNNLKISKKWNIQGSWNGTIILTNKKITKVICFKCYNHKTMACNN